MADEKIKISELDETSSLSGLYGVGADTSNHTYKFNLSATIDSKIAGKVDKVTGKGLSTNDYTDAEKTKLSGVASGAQANVIEVIKVNGTAQTVTDKTVNITTAVDPEVITNAEIDELFN